MSVVVLDASIAVELLVRRAASDLQDVLTRTPMVTVGHLDAEVLASLARMHRRGELALADVVAAIDVLAELPIERAPATAALLHDAWAMRHNVTMPDALYLALAHSVGGRVLTIDEKLRRAAPDLTLRPEDLARG